MKMNLGDMQWLVYLPEDVRRRVPESVATFFSIPFEELQRAVIL